MFNIQPFKYIFRKQVAVGLEVVFTSENTFLFNLIRLNKKGTNLLIDYRSAGIKSVEELKTKLTSKEPIILVLTGKGIINKKVKGKISYSHNELLDQVLPNANQSEFNIQITSVDDSSVFLSIIRREQLDSLLSLLKINEINNIHSCYLGPLVLNNGLPLFSVGDKSVFLFDDLQLNLKDGFISEISHLAGTKTEDIVMGDEKIEPKLALAFSAGFAYFQERTRGVINSNLLAEIVEDFKEKLKFESRGAMLLASILLLLLINLFFFNSYFDRNKDISSQLNLHRVSLNRIDSLKKDLEEKKEFLEKNGLLENSKTSFYADQLASTLPSTIRWTRLNIHPLKKNANSENDVNLIFELNKITIQGLCRRNVDLNEWMKIIKNINWVKEVELLNYKQEEALQNGAFLLDVTVK